MPQPERARVRGRREGSGPPTATATELFDTLWFTSWRYLYYYNTIQNVLYMTEMHAYIHQRICPWRCSEMPVRK